MFETGQNLPLIDQVSVTAQRRGAPSVLIHAQALMRRCMRDHAYLHFGRPAAATAALSAIDAWHTMVGHELAPGTVGKNHQLGDDLVERRAALAARDGDDVIVDVEIKINAIILLGTQTK